MGSVIAEGGISLYASSLSYRVLFAVLPFVYLLTVTGSFLTGTEVVQGAILSYTGEKFGLGAASFLAGVIAEMKSLNAYGYVNAIAVLLLLWGALGFFTELRSFFRSLRAEHEVGSFIRRSVRENLIAGLSMFILLLVAASLILGIVAVSILVSAVQKIGLIYTLHIGNFFSGVIAVVLLFGVTFRLMSSGAFSWRRAFEGACVSVSILTIVNVLFAWYVASSPKFSFYGALGFFLAFMLWIYYALYAFLLGAKTAKLLEGR